MLYVDTSVIVAYYCPEALSLQAQEVLTEQAQPALSFLTEVEFTSAVAKKVRLQNLDSVDGQRILAKFTAHVEAGLFRMIPVEKHHYRQEAGSAFCQRPCGPSRRSTWPSPPVKNCPWSPRTHPFPGRQDA